MSRPGPLSERAVILTPGGRDGQIAALILHQAGFPAEVSADLPALCGELEQGAGLAIIADEAVHTADLRSLALLLERQPPWSDLPIIMLTRRGGGPERNPTAARLAHLLGNVVFLERPFHPTTLTSMVRTAVRSRRRQYEARARLEELSEGEQRLSNLTRTLEQRVEARTADLIAEVAARERAQEQLRQSQKMESLGQLIGGIAHDFNNLLMAVVGNLELLRKRIPDDARMQRLIEGALQGAVRGASLTRRLLVFARQQDLKTAPTDLGKLLQGMRDLLERSLGPRIALRFAVAKELPPAEVDANQLELGILNVAINARDAMPDGGLIDISLDQEIIPDGQALRPGTYLRVRIADTGTGMDEATLKRAVEPFFSSKPIGKGTGLGLSMVHGLATQLGGAFSLSSQLGKGTVAQLLLPVSTSPLELIEETRIETSPARFATVLVVDDDFLIAMSTVAMLEDLGHTAIEANSGQKALEILRGEQDFNLMITDQAMPGMTGVELARMAREIRPAMPILLATGYTDVAAGGADLPRLSKPYHQSQLQTEIDKLLNSREESPGRRPSLLHGLGPPVPHD